MPRATRCAETPRPIGRAGRIFRCGLLVFIGAALLLALTIERDDLPGVTPCALRAATGWSCPSCGFTRAWIAIGHGDLATALDLNILSLPVFAAALAVAPLLAFEVATRRDVIDAFLRRHRAAVMIVLAAAIILRYVALGLK